MPGFGQTGMWGPPLSPSGRKISAVCLCLAAQWSLCLWGHELHRQSGQRAGSDGHPEPASLPVSGRWVGHGAGLRQLARDGDVD